MKTAAVFYSATGNTLYAASAFKSDCIYDIKDLIDGTESLPQDIERLGIFSPVYYGGLPVRMKEFIGTVLRNRDNGSLKYVYGVLTRGSYGRMGEQALERELLKASLTLSYSASIVFPDYYLPMMKKETCEDPFLKMKEKIDRDIERIKAETDEERISLPPFLPFSRLTAFVSEHLQKKRRKNGITADDRCTSCSLCVSVCPVNAVSVSGGKVKAGEECILCSACILCCPERALSYKGLKPKFALAAKSGD